MAQKFGIVGLDVMGRNLALNVERNGFPVAVFNRTASKTEDFMKGPAQGKNFVGAATLQEFVAALERPRRVMLMVKAGAPVDDFIAQLKGLLENGDIIIDGGNSHFPDTERRGKELEPTGIRYFGMGVSGGEEGALWGPSIMPGGQQETYQYLEPILTRIAAKADGEPCVAYIGPRGAGHFVKMVHNGIEYGDMQLIAESYDLLKNGLGLGNKEIAAIFEEWNQGELKSFLIEITARIAGFKDDQGTGQFLVELIMDKAGQKGTGKWTTLAALDLGVPIPTITSAVDARILSSYKAQRIEAAKAYAKTGKRIKNYKKKWIERIRHALYASKICSYAQGFVLLQQASKDYQYNLNFREIARIWKGGCIIRAVFLDRIRQAFERKPDLSNLLLDQDFFNEISARIGGWRQTLQLAIEAGMTIPAFAASLAYFDCLTRERLPANLLQAQRDYFGAHTYERTDRPGVFHTQWFEPK